MLTKQLQEQILVKKLLENIESNNDLESGVIDDILHWSYLSSDKDPLMIIHELLSLDITNFLSI